jgi:hypothetical protein
MFDCVNCGSKNLKYGGILMRGREKMTKLCCLDCGTNSYVGVDVYEELVGESVEKIIKQQELPSNCERLVITSAIIGSPVDDVFLETLETYCASRNARLVVIPIKYKNRDWDEDVEGPHPASEYFTYDNFYFGNEFKVMGGLRLNASMEHPLSGLESLSKGYSVIFGHPQVALKTVPSEGSYPSIITTTGCITNKIIYTDTKQGLKATFNHSNSAVVLEIDEDSNTHMRHLNFDGIGFFDLSIYYSRDTITYKEDPVIALVTGDEHVIFRDEFVSAATYTDKDSIVNVLKPKLIVRHDVMDSYSVSHHHKHNVFTQYAKYKEGYSSLADELDETIDYIVATTPPWAKSLIVSSNHNDHILRWLNECDPKEEPWNAELYHWFMYEMLKKTRMGESGAEYPNPFELYVKEFYDSSNMEFLKRTESYMIDEVSVNYHGDISTNGTRGNRSSFSKLPTKTIIGHSHSPGIDKGAYQVGTSSKRRLEYNSGPSSWDHCHCLIYKNSKRQLIFIRNRKWRA